MTFCRRERTTVKRGCLILPLLLLLSLLAACSPAAEPPALDGESLCTAQALLAASGSQTAPETVAQVAEDLALLKVTMLGELVRVEEVTQEGVTYAIDYPAAGVTDLLQVAAQEDGSTTVTVTQGEKEDVFEYPPIGTVRLNGVRLTGCAPLDQTEAPRGGA